MRLNPVAGPLSKRDDRRALAADMTGNGTVNGQDMQPFVTALLGG